MTDQAPTRLSTAAAMKFAAGQEIDRAQFSSTWLVRVTRGPDIYILNYDAGGNRAHISIHQDGSCHYKVNRGRRGMAPQAEWRLQDPIEGSEIIRLATIVIPNLGLAPPSPGAVAEDDTVLIPPPGPGRQVEIDIFAEPGPMRLDTWPGRHTLGTAFIARVTLHEESEPAGLLSITAVFTDRTEGPLAATLSNGVATGPTGETLTALRALAFQLPQVDGQVLPVLTEMPIGLGQPQKGS